MATFVGRESELGALAAAVHGAAADDAASVLIIGEPGSGKSRLLEEAASRAGIETQLHVVGYETERQVPLAAATPLLRKLADVPKHGARIDALVFGEQETTDALGSLRIFEAAFRALRELTPALLVFDDVQWADDLSLSLCHYLLRAARDTDEGLALLAAGRPSPAAAAFDSETVLELGPLEAQDSLALVSASAWASAFADGNLTVAERHLDDAGDARKRKELHHRRFSTHTGARHRHLILRH